VVGDSAGITVQTFNINERYVLTPIGSCAAIFSAGISVITGIFVDIAITIVIKAIANLSTCLTGRTFRQTILRAST
tara:strand:+ start:39 stop:266 length:228 start_codon:yes stop_codon:yes gene_type:complete